MSVAELWDRAVRITLAQPLAGDYFRAQPNAIVITDLQVAFKVDKGLNSDPNTATVTIYNLAPASLEFLQRKPLIVRVEAGYAGDPRRLFVGDLLHPETHDEGPDRITTLTLGDGARAYRFARVTPRAFRAGTDYRTILGEAAGAMGLRMPSNAAEAVALTQKVASGYTLQGRAASEMTRLLKPTGYRWSVQDGELQILADDEVRPDAAVVVSEDTGLVGSPVYGAPGEAGKPPVLSIKMLLYPSLKPGAKLKVQSRYINGLFRVQRVSHSGSAPAGGEWYSDIEATAL